jgi:hypothetical protein
LIGILYDLKQTQQGEASDVKVNTYTAKIGEFLASGWDEAVLNEYFRVSRPVYTTQVSIPRMSAKQAPEGFGVEEVVEPRMWVVHYKGQARVPMDGVYRLAGYADDVIAARINGETVLVSGHPTGIPKNFDWSPSAPDGINGDSGRLRYGTWVPLKKDDVVDLDVLIGERPGGWFGARLFVQRKGEDYPRNKNSDLILPLLQLEEKPVSEKKNRVSAPRESSVWDALR